MSWWDDNAPPTGQTVTNSGATPTATGTAPTPTTAPGPKYPNPAIQAIADAFKQYLGRDATEQELTQWGHDIDQQYLDKIIWSIRSSQEAIDYNAKAKPPATTTTPPTSGTTGTPPSYVDLKDPTQKAVWDAFQKKGKTPRDQADFQYWVGKINSTGGWSDPGNQSYWLGRMAQDQGGVGDYQERPESGGAAPLSGLGSYTPTQAPDYQPFHLPTQAEVEATPGFQWTRDQGIQGIMRAGAAHGSPLTGGVMKEAGNYASGLANQYYQNAVGNAFTTSQANNAGPFNQWQAQQGVNLGAFGANLGAQNQFWNQGFNENRNAFDQYNTSQNSAFQQWLALAQLGNPGNPYA